MAEKSTSSIDLAKVKADLEKAGVPAEHIAAFTSDLVQKVRLSNLEKEREQLRSRLDAIAAEIARLKGAPTTGRKRGRPAKVKAKGRTGRGRKRSIAPEVILTFLQNNKGQAFRREELATKLSVASASLRDPLTALFNGKKIKRKGQKRGTSYYA